MMLQKFRFFGSISALYILSIGTIGGLLYSSHLFGTPVWAKTTPIVVQKKPVKLPPKVISGKPIRIVIPDAGIDLPVDEGVYNPDDGSWTLSDQHAQFATMTSLANDHAGTTFIYGHGTDAVFGKIGTNHPPIGTTALIYTDNNRVFRYSLESIADFQPTDTSIFSNTASGPSRLIVQTCTGVFSEWRTMFTFRFKDVS